MYKYDNCSLCDGRVTERLTQKACWWGDRLIAIVDNVPAGVCEQCSEKYYRAQVLKKIEAILKKKKRLKNKIRLPLVNYA